MLAHITAADFKERIFDYTQGRDFVFKGLHPALVVFTAAGLGPCDDMGAWVGEVAKDFTGRLDIYMVDARVEKELCGVFGVTAYPTMLYLGANSKPYSSVGSVTTQTLINGIRVFLSENE